MRMAEDNIRWAVRCRGHRRNGLRCRRWAIRGGFVCPLHGGAAPQVREAARRRLLEIAAYRTLGAWQRSPAGREAWDRAELASDRAAVEAFARRLA